MNYRKSLMAGLALVALAQLVLAQRADPAPNRPQPTSGDETSTGSIRGRVFLPDGTPYNQVVKLTLTTSQLNEFISYTDFQGQFDIKGLPTGNYQIAAEADRQHFEVVTQRVQVFKDAPSVITITLKEKTDKPSAPAAAPGVVSASELDKNVPKDARKEYERALKAADERKPDEAIVHLQKAVALYPDFMMAYNNLGAQLLEAGRLDEAAIELRTAVKLDPKAFNPRLNLGLVLLKQREFAGAAQVLDQAISLDPQAPAARLYAGMAQMALKDFDRAEKELHRAYESGGAQYALALFYLGQLYLSKGDRAQALQNLEAYLHDAPAAPNAEQVKKLIGTLR
jgi:tetratricopeptide (TPR) repeat protein